MSDETNIDHPRAPGSTTIAPAVLVSIARLAALSIDGVAAMAPLPAGVNRLLRRSVGEGVEIAVRNGVVAADLYLILEAGTNVREVSRAVQAEVGRAIEEMVGMQIANIDVHIQDITYDQLEDQGQE